MPCNGCLCCCLHRALCLPCLLLLFFKWLLCLPMQCLKSAAQHMRCCRTSWLNCRPHALQWMPRPLASQGCLPPLPLLFLVLVVVLPSNTMYEVCCSTHEVLPHLMVERQTPCIAIGCLCCWILHALCLPAGSQHRCRSSPATC